jgi:hypothetical protein
MMQASVYHVITMTPLPQIEYSFRRTPTLIKEFIKCAKQHHGSIKYMDYLFFYCIR